MTDNNERPGIDSYDKRFKYNFYTCEDGHYILVAEVDKGTTPMFVTCRLLTKKKRCGRLAASGMSPEPPPPDYMFPVNIIFRKPTKDEIKDAKRSNPKMLNHYDSGGLHMEWVND